MLRYMGHIELPVCSWMSQDNEYKPVTRLFNIANIREVDPVPEDNVCPPAGEDRCRIDASSGAYYCFLSYQEVCDRVDASVKKFLCGREE